jgi:IS5 family transposase
MTFSGHFISDIVRPTLIAIIVASLLYLQNTFDFSDELLVNTWVENPELAP